VVALKQLDLTAQNGTIQMAYVTALVRDDVPIGTGQSFDARCAG
jgi:hypothetical protein